LRLEDYDVDENIFNQLPPDIPVLLMSGFSHIELDEIIKRGAVDFIIKPLDLDVLLSKVRRALDPKSLE